MTNLELVEQSVAHRGFKICTLTPLQVQKLENRGYTLRPHPSPGMYRVTYEG